MSETNRSVFLFDVDNTLLDNDRVTSALKKFLTEEVGEERTAGYWKIFEELRSELGYADYLGALQEYRCQFPYDSHVLALSNFLIDYPFANRLFPGSLDVIEKLQALWAGRYSDRWRRGFSAAKDRAFGSWRGRR